jgi:apolipoprotein D and lipocalin family protein
MRAVCLALWALFATGAADAAPVAPLTTVPSVDLQRYLGVWHELARYDNWFQGDDCVNVTAEYGIDKDGDVSVLNTCRNASNEITDTAEGYARVEENSGNARLRVSFFWPIFADYWIVALADDYSWVIVSEPGRDYLWILTRSATTSDTERDTLVAKAASLGFDPARLVYSRH